MVGVLKGYDQLLNLVLDEAVEFLRGAPGLGPLSGHAAPLVARGLRCAAPVPRELVPPQPELPPTRPPTPLCLQTLRTPCV